MPRRFRVGLSIWLLAGLVSAGGCVTTTYYQREKIADRAMSFDGSGTLVYLRNKAEAAREGGLGGFGANVVGGCGCQ